MKRIKLLRSTSFKKKIPGISSTIRNASFSSGWLRLVVQSLFAVIIVTSFILIVLMATYSTAYKQTDSPPKPPKNRCFSKNCVVSCSQVPYFDEYEEDIVFTVSQLPESCPNFYLVLHSPMFHNGILQSNWIPRLRLPIIELGITGGNLHHLTPNSFLYQHAAHIRSLVLHNLFIKTWDTDSLVGLSHLEELWIKNCTIVNVAANVLRSVHNTLESLTISSNKQWDPENITGTTNLSSVIVVDFSNNIFNDILDKNSFTGLKNCRMLYLNSCNISAIGEGAFDNLHKIETLFLNDNQLLTIPNNLFRNILTLTNPAPRINLHNNNWHCDCFTNNMRELVITEVLLTCPICKTPDRYAGKSFFELVSFCNYSAPNEGQTYKVKNKLREQSFNVTYINNGCYSSNLTFKHGVMKLLSPINNHQCSQNQIKNGELRRISVSRNNYPMVSKNNWIKFSFFLNTDNYSILQIIPNQEYDYGILWYQSTCPNEVYCIDENPVEFNILNVDSRADYVFCPVGAISGIDKGKCVTYSHTRTIHPKEIQNKLQLLLFLLTGAVCLALGAICVYALVRTHPGLLKGSKRILFVKHKTVDALVLPPKVSVRKDSVNEVHPDLNEENIFTVPSNSFGNRKFYGNISMRSSKSNAPSYISAVQPSELQLTEWRIKNHVTNEVTSELTMHSWLYNPDHYIDIFDNDVTYESLSLNYN